MNRALKPLDAIGASDARWCGGKAFNCARLRQGGFPVPDGLVIPPHAGDAELSTLPGHPWLAGVPADCLFAVRSSALGEDSSDHSFAGIHQTHLNVARADLRDRVIACRRSAESSEALAYRRAHGMATDRLQTAVLIQPMVHPVAAGVAFTLNPVTGATDELVINSSWGLGEAVVGGLVTPDEFRVRKSDGVLLSHRNGGDGDGDTRGAASLSGAQLAELAALFLAIEREFETPQDIEWCHDGARCWIVQSRPITGRSPVGEVEWTRANLVEVLPDLTCPQALKVFEHMLNEGERRYMGRLMAPETRLGPMVKAFSGRLYFNLSQLRHISAVAGAAPAALLRSFGHAGEIRPEDERVVRPPLRERLSCLPSMLRMVARHLRSDGLFRTQLALLRQLEMRLSQINPSTLTDIELWTPIEEWARAAPRALEVVLVFGGVLIHEDVLRKMCERVGFPFERLLLSQLASGERSVSSQQAFDLVALADAARSEPAVARWLSDDRSPLGEFRSALAGTTFLAAFDRFLEAYGHRGRYESDWSLPRYREDPVPLLGAIQVHLHHPAGDSSEAAARQTQEAAAIWAEFEQRLTRWQRRTLLPRARARMQTIKRYYLSRERCRSEMVRVLAALRNWHLVLARRLADRGWIDAVDDYFLLHFEEIAAAIRDGSEARRLRGIADTRRAELDQYRRLDMPLLMRESELVSLLQTTRDPDGDDDKLYGVPVSRGSIEGYVAVVDDPGNFGQMQRGAILVARATDPSWTPLFTLASGVIVEVGGVLSHASTIAREYGLPALANVKHATRRLKTGDRVRLDADRGVVQRLAAV